jgi:hypothetical protein
MIAVTILGAAVIGIVSPLCASHVEVDARAQTNASLSLARQLLEEIGAKPYLGTDGLIHNGPDAGMTTRAAYTSQGNYNGYSDSTSSLTMLDGTSVSLGLPVVYRRSVGVQYLSSRTGTASSTGDYALITVTVSATNLPTVSLSRMTTKAKEVF